MRFQGRTYDVKRWCDATGMRENIKKREGLAMGKYRSARLPDGVEWAAEGGWCISLGVPIGNDLNDEKWWSAKIREVRAKAKRWMGLYRSSYFGRNLIVTSDVLRPFKILAVFVTFKPTNGHNNPKRCGHSLVVQGARTGRHNEQKRAKRGFMFAVRDRLVRTPRWGVASAVERVIWGCSCIKPYQGKVRKVATQWLGLK